MKTPKKITAVLPGLGGKGDKDLEVPLTDAKIIKQLMSVPREERGEELGRIMELGFEMEKLRSILMGQNPRVPILQYPEMHGGD
jgi:hypothetical protein